MIEMAHLSQILIFNYILGEIFAANLKVVMVVPLYGPYMTKNNRTHLKVGREDFTL